MRRRHLLFSAPVFVASPAGAVAAFAVQSVALCQPNFVLLQRLGRPQSFSAYVLKLESNMGAVFTTSTVQGGANAAMVVAVKPGGQARAWLVDPSGTLAGLATPLIAAASAVTPPAIRNGPIAFAVIFAAWGGGAPLPTGFPIPAAWAGATGMEVIPDGPLARIWP